MGSTVGFCSFCTQHEIALSLSRPSLLQSLKPRQRLTHTTMEAMDWDTVCDPMDTDWVVLATATVMDFTTARGRQRLSPRLRLSPTTTVTVLATTDLVTGLVTVMAMDFTTARGKRRLSPRLRLALLLRRIRSWLPRTWLQARLRLRSWTLLRKEGSRG